MIMRKNIVEKLLDLQQKKWCYSISHFLLAILGLEIPKEVVLGKDVHFVHRAPGTVIRPSTKLGDYVQIYQGVTIGVAIPWKDDFARIHRGRLSENYRPQV